MADDPHNLQRFVDAQSDLYELVCDELQCGEKRSHWMWFIFPQLVGLAPSCTAFFFGITGRREAEAYLAHPVLGERLRHCTQLTNHIEGRSARQIFGSPDDLKFRSSMTLFANVTVRAACFQKALQIYFADHEDRATLERLK